MGAPGNDHPDGIAAPTAAADYINANGGFVGNRPVQIVSCNAQGSPIACPSSARRRSSARRSLASRVVSRGLPPPPACQAPPTAGIPYVGLGVAAQDFSNPISYPMFSTVAAGFPAQVKYFVQQGVKSVAVVVIDIPEGLAAAELTLVKPFEAAGVKAITIPAAPGAPSMTPVVQKALQGNPQVIFMLQDADDSLRVAQSATQLGYTDSFAPAGVDSSYIKGSKRKRTQEDRDRS